MVAGRAALHIREVHGVVLEAGRREVEGLRRREHHLYACPLPHCTFTISEQEQDSGLAAIHYV